LYIHCIYQMKEVFIYD